MSLTDVLLARNREFAATTAQEGVPLVPRQQLFVITCLDPRTDPAGFLGLQPGDAMVIRNAGGRVTPRVLDDLAFISYLAETMVAADGPLFEIAVVHHTECGTGFLADPQFRRGFAERAGLDEQVLAAEAVTDPTATVCAACSCCSPPTGSHPADGLRSRLRPHHRAGRHGRPGTAPARP